VINCEQLMHMIEFLLVIHVKFIYKLIILLIDTFPHHVCLLQIFKMTVYYDLPFFARQFVPYIRNFEFSSVLNILKYGSLKMIEFFIENIPLIPKQIISLIQSSMKYSTKNVQWCISRNIQYESLSIPTPYGLNNPFVCLGGFTHTNFDNVYNLKTKGNMWDVDSKLIEQNNINHEKTEYIIHTTSHLAKDLLNIVIKYLFKRNTSGFELYLKHYRCYFYGLCC